MDIIDIRRKNLEKWVATHGVPTKEKSLFSQLKGTASFGEKVARRLEDDYKMGTGYLDTPIGSQEDLDEGASKVMAPSPASPPPWMDSEAFALLGLFYDLDIGRRRRVMQYIKDLKPSIKGAAGANKS
jgi:hypothetical protein